MPIHIRAGNPQTTSVWQSWLAPLELVKNKQGTAFDVFDQQAFAADVEGIFAGKQAKSEQKAALLELVKSTLADALLLKRCW